MWVVFLMLVYQLRVYSRVGVLKSTESRLEDSEQRKETNRSGGGEGLAKGNICGCQGYSAPFILAASFFALFLPHHPTFSSQLEDS